MLESDAPDTVLHEHVFEGHEFLCRYHAGEVKIILPGPDKISVLLSTSPRLNGVVPILREHRRGYPILTRSRDNRGLWDSPGV